MYSETEFYPMISLAFYDSNEITGVYLLNTISPRFIGAPMIAVPSSSNAPYFLNIYEQNIYIYIFLFIKFDHLTLFAFFLCDVYASFGGPLNTSVISDPLIFDISVSYFLNTMVLPNPLSNEDLFNTVASSIS